MINLVKIFYGKNTMDIMLNSKEIIYAKLNKGNSTLHRELFSLKPINTLRC